MGLTFQNGDTCWLRFTTSDIKGLNPKDITNYVTSASITFDWDSDTKASGSFEVSGIDPSTLNRFVNVGYVQNRNGKEDVEWLCRFAMSSNEGDYIDGLWSGTVSLTTTLDRFNKTMARYAKLIGAYSGYSIDYAIGRFLHICDNVYLGRDKSTFIAPGVKNIYVGDLYCKEEDTLMVQAGWCEGENRDNTVTVRNTGLPYLVKSPTSSSPYKTITAGENSCIFPGLSYSDDSSDAVNRATMKFTDDDNNTIISSAVLPSSNKRSMDKIGYFIDYVGEFRKQKDEKNPSSAKLKRLARFELYRRQKRTGREWTFSSMKLDTPIGTNIQLKYDDKTTKKGLVVRVDLSMDASTGCAPIQTTTFREW